MACRTMAHRTMAYRTYGALIASLGVAALLLASSTATYARSGTAPRGTFSAHHPAFRHHVRVPGIVLPGTSGYYEDAVAGVPFAAEVPGPASNDVRYTYTQDVPWD